MLLFEKPLFRNHDRDTKREAYGHGWKDERVEERAECTAKVFQF